MYARPSFSSAPSSVFQVGGIVLNVLRRARAEEHIGVGAKKMERRISSFWRMEGGEMKKMKNEKERGEKRMRANRDRTNPATFARYLGQKRQAVIICRAPAP